MMLMPRRAPGVLGVVALAAALAGPAHALGPQDGLKNTPGAKFNSEDIALMKAQVFAALKSEKEGDPLEWKNDKTGASGTVVPMNHLTWNGLQCRRLRIANAFQGQTAQGVYKFCQKPPGTWKLAGEEVG
jgi:surface antigen